MKIRSDRYTLKTIRDNPRNPRPGAKKTIHDDPRNPRPGGRENDPRRSASRQTDPRSARVAVAPTQIGAMLLSSAYPGLTVVTGEMAAALAPVGLEVLRQVCVEIHGRTLSHEQLREDLRDPRPVAEKTIRDDPRNPRPVRTICHLCSRSSIGGLTTLGELAALPAGALSARLGQAGVTLRRMAAGIDASPLVPDGDVPRFFDWQSLALIGGPEVQVNPQSRGRLGDQETGIRALRRHHEAARHHFPRPAHCL